MLVATVAMLAWASLAPGQPQMGKAPVRAGATRQLSSGTGPLREDRVYLRSGVLDASVAQHAQTARPIRNPKAAAQGAEPRVIVQLDGPMTPERRRMLQRAGVQVGQYLPSNAFVCKIDQADPRALAQCGFIRWRTDYTADLKLDPGLREHRFDTPERQRMDQRGEAAIVVTLFQNEPTGDLERFVVQLPGGGIVHTVDAIAGNPVIVATVRAADVGTIAGRPEVQYIERAPELTDRSNLKTNWIVQSNVLNVTPLNDAGLTGMGQIIGVIDSSSGGLDINHCSFSDSIDNTPGPSHRKILAYNSNIAALAHATHVSATAAGLREDGVVDDTRGIAFDAKIVYDNFPAFQETLIYNTLAQHHNQGARVHTNSWGDDSAAWYTSLCRGIDSFAYDFEESLVVFASTNQANLRSPENAKNLLAVGATGYPGDLSTPEDVCTGGAGPTSDGRRKPEIFAPGCNTASAFAFTTCLTRLFSGTSMASPAIAGTGVLVRQYFVDGYFPTGAPVPADGFSPTGALVKAVLLNSAVDMTGVSGYPTDQEGWGRLLADNALFFAGDTRSLIVDDVWNATGLSTGGSAALGVGVNSAAEPLKVTLVWTGPPAAPAAHFVLVNDLDLEVLAPDGTLYLGNAFAGGQSVSGGVRDDRNNVEQVLIAAPLAGTWTVRVRGTAVNVGTQGYALVVTGHVTSAAAPLSIASSGASVIAPGALATISAQVSAGDDVLMAQSPTLFARNGSGAFSPVPMTDLGGGLFQATLPLAFCGDTFDYYVQAQGVATGAVTDPTGAPAAFLSSSVGAEVVLIQDDLEANLGWMVGDPSDTATAGIWERVDPLGSLAQPEDDHSPAGTVCWVTEQHVAGMSDAADDVDGPGGGVPGVTTLVSPVYDISTSPEARISYWRWFYSFNGTPSDTFRVDISPNAGLSWTTVETIGVASITQTLGGWAPHTFRVADFIVPTSTVQLRFVATDGGFETIVEAGVDDLRIVETQCINVLCVGDANGDMAVNFDDITAVVSNWGSVPGPGTGGPGDANHDGIVDFGDITAVVANWLSPCG